MREVRTGEVQPSQGSPSGREGSSRLISGPVSPPHDRPGSLGRPGRFSGPSVIDKTPTHTPTPVLSRLPTPRVPRSRSQSPFSVVLGRVPFRLFYVPILVHPGWVPSEYPSCSGHLDLFLVLNLDVSRPSTGSVAPDGVSVSSHGPRYEEGSPVSGATGPPRVETVSGEKNTEGPTYCLGQKGPPTGSDDSVTSEGPCGRQGRDPPRGGVPLTVPSFI